MVIRNRVLRRPAMRDLGDVPMLTGEVLEHLEALGVRLGRAGGVALSAEDEQVAIGADRASRAAGADRQSLRQFAVDARSHAIRAPGLKAREEKPPIEERVMGGVYDIVGRDH